MKKQSAEQRYMMLTNGEIPSLILKLGIPTIISMLVTSFYNMVDTYFVGRLQNTSATAAVGIAFSLMSLIQAIGFFFGHGSGSYISRKLGEKDTESAETMASTGFFWAFLCGVLVAALGIIFLDPLSIILGSTKTILPFARDYMGYIVLGAPFMMASLVLNNQLRYQGNAFYAMIGIVSGAGLNIILDEILMFRLGMGISGAALATVISQISSFFLLLIGVNSSGGIKIRIKAICISKKYLKEIFRGGVPSLCRQGITTVTNISLNFVAVLAGGDAAVAAFSVVNRITMFANSALIGFGQGFQPVCGFNYGAKKYDRVEKAYKFCIKYSLGFLVLISVAVFFFAEPLVALFRDDPAVIQIGTLALRLQCLTFPCGSYIVLSNMMLQSVGKSGKASILAASRHGIFFIPLIFSLGLTLGIFGIQLTQPLADIGTFILSVVFGKSFLKEMREKEKN